ncbi:MAG: bifunctional proline dehydrogenase/L-glutamate gamma-semialdehyde dehydrogenase PutA, partial [Hyphomicrobium sp.]
SYDMLGESARTDADAARYFARYLSAIEAIGKAAGAPKSDHSDALLSRPGLSVKLSALHPRFEPGKEDRLDAELLPRLLALARAARGHAIMITIDAEEQDKLDLTLGLFARAYGHADLDGWTGLGLAVQAYGKRAIPVLRWLRRLAERGGRRIPVRLVKGAYWDSEIKAAQERGLADYPVFTRKLYTDVSYLAAMRLMLSDNQAFYPQFATHNAHTLSAALVSAGNAPFEFQRLHGMGAALYEEVVGPSKLDRPCRIYAPVGGHEDLLPYLVRRLLENGANTSFVNRLADDTTPVAIIVRDPVEAAERERADAGVGRAAKVAPLPRPREIYRPARKASAGLALSEPAVRATLSADMAAELAGEFAVGPIVGGQLVSGGRPYEIALCPHDRRQRIATVTASTLADVDAAVTAATAAAHGWDRVSPSRRAEILDHAAELFEKYRARFMAVLVREAGKTLDAAQGELRETVDHLRYAAAEARRLLSAPISLGGPTGEANVLDYRGRGPVACISPWNFPLAIFVGQIASALAAGNPVLAKPAEQSPVTAFLAVRLLHEAGVPADVLHVLPGDGRIGAALVKDHRIKAVAFTGSNDTAWAIQRALADRRGAIVPFLAETGGLNAMIADSSALPEQIVRDAVRSAFDSAGQRCSSARVLFVQSEIADRTIAMLAGATAALDVGDPMDYATDIGPVIDETAQDTLEGHKLRMQREGRQIVDVELPKATRVGTYVGPAAYEIDRLDRLDREVFGPILHVVRWERGHLDKVVAAVNASGFGLTLGLHSRIAAVADYVAEHARVGNIYVNRHQIG